MYAVSAVGIKGERILRCVEEPLSLVGVGDVHEDVAAAGAFVEVDAADAAFACVVEVDIRHHAVIVKVGACIIQIQVGAAGFAVEIALYAPEVFAAEIGTQVPRNAAFREAYGRIVGLNDFEVGDEPVGGRLRGGLFVEQEDVVAAGALVQVLVDVLPSVHIAFALAAACQHNVGEKVGPICSSDSRHCRYDQRCRQ